MRACAAVRSGSRNSVPAKPPPPVPPPEPEPPPRRASSSSSGGGGQAEGVEAEGAEGLEERRLAAHELEVQQLPGVGRVDVRQVRRVRVEHHEVEVPEA